MAKYLIDVNLPAHIEVWKGDEFIHQIEIDDEAPDSQIWDFAKENDLTIITKDSDFSEKMLFNNPPPRVIHIKLGNMKLKELRGAIIANWEAISLLSQGHKLVKVFKDRIEGIN